jgi:hypothetical protein
MFNQIRSAILAETKGACRMQPVSQSSICGGEFLAEQNHPAGCSLLAKGWQNRKPFDYIDTIQYISI